MDVDPVMRLVNSRRSRDLDPEQRKRSPLALLLTCKQIHNEAFPYLYERMRAVICSPTELKKCRNRRERIKNLLSEPETRHINRRLDLHGVHMHYIKKLDLHGPEALAMLFLKDNGSDSDSSWSIVGRRKAGPDGEAIAKARQHLQNVEELTIHLRDPESWRFPTAFMKEPLFSTQFWKMFPKMREVGLSYCRRGTKNKVWSRPEELPKFETRRDPEWVLQEFVWP